MSDDLVKRLRWRAESNANCLCGNPVCDEAADRIEKLEAGEIEFDRVIGNYASENAQFRGRIEKLEAALQWYAEHCQKGGDEIEGPFGDYGQRASKALEGKDD